MDLRPFAEVLETVAGSDEQHEPEDDEDMSKGEVVFLFVALGLIAVFALVFLLAATDYTAMVIGEEAWTMAADSCMLPPFFLSPLLLSPKFGSRCGFGEKSLALRQKAWKRSPTT